MEARLLIDGQWVAGGPLLEVRNKYTGQALGAVATARREDVDAALAAAQRAAPLMADLPAHKRSEYLLRAAALIRERRDDFARTIAAEAGKALKFARAEVDRGLARSRLLEEANGCTARRFRWMPCPRVKAILAFGCGVPSA